MSDNPQTEPTETSEIFMRPATREEQMDFAIKEQKLKHAQAKRVVEVIRGIFYVAITLFLALALFSDTSNSDARAKCESIGGRYAGECYYNGRPTDVDKLVEESSWFAK
ncbi:hypothetical protein [Megamonas hypermegale]|uniref:hypothetical protein n=1 Tax=Megamonas hypermegale TaxID=158847 RepID=UPI0026EBD9CA|nr:hypothetical protein [Megamonas hypermegale]